MGSVGRLPPRPRDSVAPAALSLATTPRRRSTSKRSVSFRSSALHGAPSGVAVPAWGSDGDPTTGGAAGGGAILTIYNPAGGSPVEVMLPAARWVRTGTAERPGYKYTDRFREDGDVSSAMLKNGALSVRGRGASLYPLADAPQGSMVVRLEVGAGLGYCGLASATAPENDTPASSRRAELIAPARVQPP